MLVPPRWKKNNVNTTTAVDDAPLVLGAQRTRSPSDGVLWMSIEGGFAGRVTLLSSASKAAISAAVNLELEFSGTVGTAMELGRPCGEASGTRRFNKPPTQPQGKVLRKTRRVGE